MSVTINGTNGLTFNDASTQTTAATGFGFKNRIINGAMVIDQRNAGAASANTLNGYFLDRWYVQQQVTGKLIAQQNAGSVTPPAGFSNYLGITSQSAYTVGTNETYAIYQPIEGLNVADLAWGTSSAVTVTLSFWVRSSLTGTFGGSLANSAQTRSYPYTYTISSANTWEQKSVTISGDTTGTWLTTNGVGIYLNIGLGVGSGRSGTAGAWAATRYDSATGATSVVGTNGATFYITGVQLEKGSTATSFDYRPYTTELQLCQRYYEVLSGIYMGGYNSAGNSDSSFMNYKVAKRATPTVTVTQTPNYVNCSSFGPFAGDISGTAVFVTVTATGGYAVGSSTTATITAAIEL